MSSIRMTDIAARVGASRSTVSFVLNGFARRHGISTKLEKQVLRAAREMNYRPSLMARGLAARRTFTLGILLPDIARSLNPVLADGILQEAQVHGYQTVVSQHGDDPEQFRRAWQTMVGWHVDGAIMVPTLNMKDTPAHRELRSASTPLVLVERDLGDAKLGAVMPDLAGAVRIAIERLFEVGHRRIGVITGPRELEETLQREKGYRQAMADAAVSFEPHWIASLTYGEDTALQAEKAVNQIFTGDRQPTALVIINNTRAIFAAESLKRRGLSVPLDVSIVTISGNRFPEHYHPRFSLVQLDYSVIGHEAVRAVVSRIENPLDAVTGPNHLFISSIWWPGQSIAAPKL